MVFKNITMACAAALLVMTPTQRASADAGDFVAGAVVGVVGSALVRNAQKNQTRTTTTRRATTYNSAARAENRQIQTSLNYFGFPAGTPDGVMGRNSRNAVSGYQIHMGYAPTGQLTQYEKDFLLTSYNRALAGGAATNQQIAANPQGPRGLLHAYRDQQAGGTTYAVAPAAPALQAPATTTVVVAPQVQPAPVPAPAVTATFAAAPAQPATALPSFLGATESKSLTSHCNQISLLTSSNGGFATEATMTDANFALNEQFCLARTYAVSQGEVLISKVQGFTPEQIAAQCQGFGATLSDLVSAVSLKPRTAVTQDVSNFVQTAGMAPAQLAGTSKICLSVGYRTDDMNVAMGSALLLSVLGEAAYGELLGHHLAQGIGAARRPDLAKEWYELALSSVESGLTPVFAPGQPERTTLLRKATLNLGSSSALPTAPQVQPVSALPTFQVEN